MAGLFGPDFDIDLNQKSKVKTLVKKASGTAKKQVKSEEEKLLASKKLTIEERLAIIKEKVIKTLGIQRSNTRVIQSLSDFSAYIDAAIQAGRIDIDTETNNTTDAVSSEMVGLCLYVPGQKQAYIPIKHVNYETGELLPNQLTYEDCRKQLQRILDYRNALRGGYVPDYPGQNYNEWFQIHIGNIPFIPHADYKIIMHNGKFDYEVIKKNCNIAVAPDWDTLVAARLIDENLYSDKRTSLKWLYVNLIDPKQAKYDIEGLFENIPYAYVDPEIFALYAATDSMMTDKIYLWEKPFFEGVDNEKLKWLFEHIEMPIVEVTAKMEMRGCCVDQVFGALLKAKYNGELVEIDNKINAILAQLKDTLDIWRLSPAANEKTRTYVPKKSKMSQAKIEEQYDKIDTDGRRYKETKPKAEQLKDPINLNASTQLAILFYDVLCVSEVYEGDRKTGKDNLKGIAEALKPLVTDEQKEALQKAIEADAVDEEENSDATPDITPEDYEEITRLTPEKATIAASLCSLLLERRGLTKLITTYIDTIPDLAMHWADGRVRFRLNSTGTNTGRYSSGGKWKFLDANNNKVELPGINIQNIPSHNPEIRMLFKAQVDKFTTNFQAGIGEILKEITEVETTNGYVFVKELTEADKLLTTSGNIVNIEKVTYNPDKKASMIFTEADAVVNCKNRYKIIGSDYSAQEPRLTAFISQDQQMIEAYMKGRDLYAVIAQSAFHNNYEENLEFYPEGTVIEENGEKITCGYKTHMNKQGKERRKVGKTLQLAATYGMSGTTAGIRLGYSPKDARKEGDKLLNNFFTGFPDVKNTIDYSKEFLRKNGYVEDWAGRRRHLPEINDKKYDVHLKENNEIANFNPFLGCACRDDQNDQSVQYWWSVVRNRINASQTWQQKMAEKDGRHWEPNDEMSNKSYDQIAKLALEGKPFVYTNKKTGKEIIPVPLPNFELSPVIITANTGRIAQAERQCFNARIQGGAASLTKLAMINIDRDPLLNELDAHLIITVHDEVLVECPALYADEVEKRLPQIMIDTAKPYINVPMKCDPYNVSRWYADEAAVALRDEFEKLEKKKVPHDIALQQLYNIHSELSPEVINNAIINGTDLEF